MRSLGPAGWASHGFFGFGAKTFGNPGGATSGDGYFVPGQSGGVTPTPISWTNRGQPSPGESAFALATVAGSTMLMLANGTSWLSTDGGHTWAEKGTVTGGLAAAEAYGSMVMSSNVQICVAAPQSGGTQVHHTATGGITWGGAISSGIGNTGFIMMANDGATVLGVGGPNEEFDPANYGMSATTGAAWSLDGVTTLTFFEASQYPQSVFWDTVGNQWVVLGKDIGISRGAVATSPDGENWTGSEGPALGLGQALTSGLSAGGQYYVGGGVSVYQSATIAGLLTAAPINPAGVTPLMMVKDTATFFVLDQSGNVANTGPSGFGKWIKGELNMAAGEGALGVVYDVTNNSVIACGSQGTICTVP